MTCEEAFKAAASLRREQSALCLSVSSLRPGAPGGVVAHIRSLPADTELFEPDQSIGRENKTETMELQPKRNHRVQARRFEPIKHFHARATRPASLWSPRVYDSSLCMWSATTLLMFYFCFVFIRTVLLLLLFLFASIILLSPISLSLSVTRSLFRHTHIQISCFEEEEKNGLYQAKWIS